MSDDRLRQALVRLFKVEEKLAEGIRLLDTCLDDEVAWEPEDLVKRMEDVRYILAVDLAEESE